jgi:hypothetical protein
MHNRPGMQFKQNRVSGIRTGLNHDFLGYNHGTIIGSLPPLTAKGRCSLQSLTRLPISSCWI